MRWKDWCMCLHLALIHPISVSMLHLKKLTVATTLQKAFNGVCCSLDGARNWSSTCGPIWWLIYCGQQHNDIWCRACGLSFFVAGKEDGISGSVTVQIRPFVYWVSCVKLSSTSYWVGSIFLLSKNVIMLQPVHWPFAIVVQQVLAWVCTQGSWASPPFSKLLQESSFFFALVQSTDMCT